MCISYCHKTKILFDNHADCETDVCPFANPIHNGPCQTCQNRQGQVCSLTNTPLPDGGGCCHWNVAFVENIVVVIPAMVAPLPMVGFFDRVKNVLPADVPRQRHSSGKWFIPSDFLSTLNDLGIKYQRINEGLIVDPEQLILAISEPVIQILDRFGVPYYHSSAGDDAAPSTLLLDPGDLSLPITFGLGTGNSYH